MKKRKFLRVGLMVWLLAGMLGMPVNSLYVQAADIIATVEGTVLAKTTSELMFLSTSDGEMQVKLDKNTDTSECKVLLPEKKIRVALTHGSDGYLHAAKLMNSAQAADVKVDSSSTATVTGTLSSQTKGDLLYVKTPQGDMQIKLDSTTDMSGCTVLVAGQVYTIVCARGTDAYMHAVRITGGALAAAAASWVTPAPTDPDNAPKPTMTIAGKVKKGTTDGILELSTNEGDLKFFIDYSTDTRQGMMLLPDLQVAVAYYKASDSNYHATCIVGVKSNVTTATIQNSGTVSVTGTVGKKSNEELLYLDTPQGEMQIKLDAVNKVSGCKVLLEGKKITVTCAGGSDAYLHAIEITAG